MCSRLTLILSFTLLAATAARTIAQESAPTTAPVPYSAVPFQKVTIADPFWLGRLEANRTKTLPACLEQCEETGRIRNFAVAGRLVEGKFEGILYNDSDVFKVIEGAAYALHTRPDPELEKAIDAIIEKIVAAQQEDGYLNTFHTLVEPENRWKIEQHHHELYCAGHLFEAATAYADATGKKRLLEAAVRYADLIDRTFGPGKRADAPGHQEIELALVKLARATGERRYLRLAAFFLDCRGRFDGRPSYGEYCQDQKPVREQKEAVGHAVRAMYQYCGMADVARATGDMSLLAPLKEIWNDVTERKMYVTGGIGPSAKNEGFTVPFDLPNDTAYCETCAAIGLSLWAHRMFLLTGDFRFADVLERSLYNNVLSGVALSGDRFFYDNPLGSRGEHRRVPWFDCSCCPTNIVRYLPAIGERIFAARAGEIAVVLHADARASIPLETGVVEVSIDTDYPFAGRTVIAVKNAGSEAVAVRVRTPAGFATAGDAKVRARSGRAVLTAPKSAPGALLFSVDGGTSDSVEIHWTMKPERVRADPRILSNHGRVALAYGPFVYCLEAVDNGGHARNIALPPTAPLRAVVDPDRFGGTVVIRADALARTEKSATGDSLPHRLEAIPYHLWANRAAGEMVVWIPESPADAEVPGRKPLAHAANGSTASASHCFAADRLEAIGDLVLPKSSSDDSVERQTFWPRRGGDEWLQYDFAAPREVRAVGVYWFDDTGRGSCRTPESWRVLALIDGVWKPVDLAAGQSFGTSRDTLNRVGFRPVTTTSLRLEIKLRERFSAGCLEWTVEPSP